MPGIVEQRWNQLQELEAVLEHLNIQLRRVKTKHYKKKNGLIGIECYLENDPYIVDATQRVKLACLLIFDELVKPLIASNKVSIFSNDTGFIQLDDAIVSNIIKHMESFLVHVEDSLRELKQ